MSTSTLADLNDDWISVNEQSDEDIQKGEKQGSKGPSNTDQKQTGRQSDKDQSRGDQDHTNQEQGDTKHQKLKHKKRGFRDQKRGELDFDYTLLLSPSRQHVLQERRTLHTIPEMSGVYESRSLPELSKLQRPNTTLVESSSLHKCTSALPKSHSLPELSALPQLSKRSELTTRGASNQPKLTQYPMELTSEMKSSLTTAIHSRWNPCITQQQILFDEKTYAITNSMHSDKGSKRWSSSTGKQISAKQRLGPRAILPSPLHRSFGMTSSTRRGHLFSSISALEKKVQKQTYSNVEATSQSNLAMYQILSSSCAHNQVSVKKPRGWNQFAWSDVYPLLQKASHGNRTQLNMAVNNSRVPHLRLPPMHLISSVHFSKYAVMQTFPS